MNRREFLTALPATALVAREFLGAEFLKGEFPTLTVARPPWVDLSPLDRARFYTALMEFKPEYHHAYAITRISPTEFKVGLFHGPRVHLRTHCPDLIARHGIGTHLPNLGEPCRTEEFTPLTPHLAALFTEFTAPTPWR